jgi:hypothetical protein
MRAKTTRAAEQPNALLTFAGEQDIEFFCAAMRGVVDLGSEESGGSRELSLRAEGDRIVVGYKRETDV